MVRDVFGQPGSLTDGEVSFNTSDPTIHSIFVVDHNDISGVVLPAIQQHALAAQVAGSVRPIIEVRGYSHGMPTKAFMDPKFGLGYVLTRWESSCRGMNKCGGVPEWLDDFRKRGGDFRYRPGTHGKYLIVLVNDVVVLVVVATGNFNNLLGPAEGRDVAIFFVAAPGLPPGTGIVAELASMLEREPDSDSQSVNVDGVSEDKSEAGDEVLSDDGDDWGR